MKKQVAVGISTVCLAAAISVSALAVGMHHEKKADSNPPEKVTVQSPVDKTTVVNDRSLTKANIFHKMINAVDYYDTVRGKFTEPNLGVGETTVEYQAGISAQTSYQRLAGAQIDQEQYTQDGKAVTYDNKARTFRSVGVPVYHEDLQAVRTMDRLTTAEDGYPECTLRGDRTYTGIAASLSLMPQEITFNYLGDFDRWEIKGTETYLNREAVRIEGVTTKDSAEKLDVYRFVFLVDLDTGILLRYDGYSSDGKLTDYMHTEEIFINQGLTVNMNARDVKYAGYQDVFR